LICVGKHPIMVAMKKKKILVTGGAGYIGSHTVKKLLEDGYEAFVIDNLSTGNKKLLQGTNFLEADIADIDKVEEILKSFKPDAVIHFSASKDAAESVAEPAIYFGNNVAKTIIFLDMLLKFDVKNIIFSSTAAVYGDVQKFPITEDFSLKPTNPYGLSKLMIEQVLLEYKNAYGLKPMIFRYFNAGGADSTGKLGNMYPDPKDVVSMVMKAASGEIPRFEIYGTDYDTRDGSCIRDIIHVEDLAAAHVLGLEKLLGAGVTGIYNLGSEQGYSIREIVETAKELTGVDFPVVDTNRRAGDIVVSIASSEKAKRDLGWQAKYNLEDIISSAWNWHEKNL
jgi:UDP-glucose 4-epimerase